MVFGSEDILGPDMLAGKFGVTLAECSVARVDIVATLDIAISVSVLVFDKLADASVSVGHASALQAILVGLADGVESVNWWTVTWVGHWAVT